MARRQSRFDQLVDMTVTLEPLGRKREKLFCSIFPPKFYLFLGCIYIRHIIIQFNSSEASTVELRHDHNEIQTLRDNEFMWLSSILGICLCNYLFRSWTLVMLYWTWVVFMIL